MISQFNICSELIGPIPSQFNHASPHTLDPSIAVDCKLTLSVAVSRKMTQVWNSVIGAYWSSGTPELQPGNQQ